MSEHTGGPPGARAGLREAHCHLAQLGRAQAMLDLSACRSPGDLLDAVAERARTLPDGAPVLAHSARPEAWDSPVWPPLAELDRACAGRACLAWCFDYHALMASSAMLAAAGIGRDAPDPPGGVILRDASGSPTGVLLERAALDCWSAVPEPAAEERREHVRAACSHLAGLGFAEAHDLKAQPWLPEVLADLDRAGELPLRAVLFPLVQDLPEMAARRGSFEGERIRLGGAKLFADGTLNSRTAWMLEPYADGRPEHPRGTPMATAEEIREAVRRTDALGLPLAAHAIGDAAVRAVLDAIEEVRPRTPGYRIEHAELVDAADVPRFARLGVVCSPQPCHLLADVEALRRGVPDRLRRVLPLRELIDAGLEPGRGLVFGSDTPIVRADPRDSVRAAADRRRPNAPAEEAIAAEQAIAEAEAWACFAAG